MSSASVERSSSCLKRVKTYLRTTMGQNRLSCLCRISIHKNILKSMEDANQLHELVLAKFVEEPTVYTYLYYKLNFPLPLVSQKYVYREKTISVGDPVYIYL